MTRSVYLGVLVLFAASVLGGLYLALPTPEELWPTELDCAEWHEAPVEGHVRLLGCEVDARFPSHHHLGPVAQDVLVAVRPSEPSAPTAHTLLLYSDHPDLLSWADQVVSFGDDVNRHQRYAERHAARLVVVRDVEGVVGRPGGIAADLVALDENHPRGVLVLDETRPSIFGRTAGVFLLLLGLLGAAALFFAQRKWTRSRDRITARVRPLEF